MTPFFETTGRLTAGFQGHVAFHMHLQEPLGSLRITLELTHPEPASSTVGAVAAAASAPSPEGASASVVSAASSRIAADTVGNAPGIPPAATPERPRHIVDKKNEVHVEAFLDGQFLGGLHKHRDVRSLVWSPAGCGEGCMPHAEPFAGMLTIQLIAFNILESGLDYRLFAEECEASA